jgi:hypothetical protein
MMRLFHKAEVNLPGEQLLHRIAALTLGFGFASAVLAVVLDRPDWAKGLAGGAILGWLNFRWLSRGIRAVMNVSLTQATTSETAASADEESVSSPKSMASVIATYFALLFRYALVALGVYVIFIYLHVPLVSIGLGLCAFVAAIMTASVWEVLRSES